MKKTSDRYLIPEWPAPKQVKACVTCRIGGHSQGLFSSFNLGTRSGDDLEAVYANRQLLNKDWNWISSPQWLKQVHGVEVVKARADDIEREGDAVWTDVPNLPCAVLTGDCLPVIFCNNEGTKVAVAHAGWKGLLNGVLENTVKALGEPSESIMAWMGPAISQRCFEVGAEVRSAFLNEDAESSTAFVAGNGDRFFGDLYQLARLRFQRAGIHQVFGGGLCTVSNPESWFSYRRDGVESGRLATLVWIEKSSSS